MVIWEGVTMYLKKDVVLDTLKTFRRNCAVGSVISFDYLFGEIITEFKLLTQRIGEPFFFGLEQAPDWERHFLEVKCGLRMLDVLHTPELYRVLQKRYEMSLDRD